MSTESPECEIFCSLHLLLVKFKLPWLFFTKNQGTKELRCPVSRQGSYYCNAEHKRALPEERDDVFSFLSLNFSLKGSAASFSEKMGWLWSFLSRELHPFPFCGPLPTTCTLWPWRNWQPPTYLLSTAATRPLSFSCPGSSSRTASWAYGLVSTRQQCKSFRWRSWFD